MSASPKRPTRIVLSSLLFTGALAFGLTMSGCNEVRIPVNATMPATKVDLAKQGVKRIAIGEINTPRNAGTTQAGIVGDDLRASLVDIGRFEILDRTAVSALLQEHSFTASGMADQSTTVASGNFKGATALIIGNLTGYNVDSQVNRLPRQVLSAQGAPMTVNFYQRVTTASVEVSFKLIDVETGKLIAVVPCTAKSRDVIPKSNRTQTPDYFGLNEGKAPKEDEGTFQETEPAEPDTTELMSEVRKKAVAQFVQAIAPYQISMNVVIENDSAIPGMDAGVRSAQLGDWPEAEASFQAAIKTKPDSPEAYYDLGIAQRSQGKFTEAIASFKAAFRLKAKALYQNEMVNTKKYAEGERQK